MTDRPARGRHTAPFAARLLAWFDANRRDLPWRRTRDPWAIWVSEIMLQQTRVEAVRAAWERFVARYPTAASFAATSDDELLLAWRGLGYYRRARLLRDGARCVVAEHGGAVPPDAAALAALPGVGDYTQAAIGSIAFDLPLAAIDGNVERVIARHAGIRDEIKSAPGKRALRAALDERFGTARPGDFNQAMMDLGATVCAVTSPRCAACPIAADCVARARDLTATLPVRRPPRAAVDVHARVVLVTGPHGALGARVPTGQPNAGQLELPGPGILQSCDAGDLAAALRDRFGARCAIGAAIATVRHAITHHRIVLHAHAAELRAAGRLEWHPCDGETPWTTPARKVFRAAAGAMFAD